MYTGSIPVLASKVPLFSPYHLMNLTVGGLNFPELALVARRFSAKCSEALHLVSTGLEGLCALISSLPAVSMPRQFNP